MSLEEALKENSAIVKSNTEAMNRFIDVLERLSSFSAEANLKGDKKEAPAKSEKAEEPAPEKKKTPAKKQPTVKLADLQKCAGNILKKGGPELKAKAKQVIQDIAGDGAKISGLPKHPEAAEVMPKVLEALKEIEAEIPEEEEI